MTKSGVLIASNFANDTGYAWTFFFRLQSVVARALSNRGIAVFLSFAHINGPVTTIDPDIPFLAFEFDPQNITLRSAWTLARKVRRHRIRFVYLTDLPTWHWLYALIRMAGVRRIVVHSHVSVANPNPAPPERGLQRLAKRVVHLTSLRADAVYAVSQFVAQRLAAKACYPASRTHLIRYGIDLDRYLCPETAAKVEPLRIFVGARATRFKGVQILIEASNLLKARKGIPSFVVHYAGDGPDLEAFRAQAREACLEGRFVFLGALPSTLAELCAADIVVVPSIWGDASPLAAIEALAAGKAIVAAAAGGLPEIIGGPDTGVLVPPGDAAALAEALASLLTDQPKRAALGANAKRRAHELYCQAAFHRTIVDRVLADFGISA